MSIGWNPFFNGKEKTAEPWILHDFDNEFYGVEIRIMLVGYIRPEAGFTTLQNLIDRIKLDGELSLQFGSLANASDPLERPLTAPKIAKHRALASIKDERRMMEMCSVSDSENIGSGSSLQVSKGMWDAALGLEHRRNKTDQDRAPSARGGPWTTAARSEICSADASKNNAMADWEDDEWDAGVDNFQAKLDLNKKAPAFETKGHGILAGVTEPDMSKFADEEEEEEEEEPKHVVIAPQPKKKEVKKYMKAEIDEGDQPLDDPELEKQRKQRMIEQADYAASVKDFDEYATAISNKYCIGHKDSKNYKAFIKALAKSLLAPLPSSDVKDIETSIAGYRSEKMKAEQAEASAKSKNSRLKQLHGGKGGLTAGLDDYIYDDAGDGDDFDFM
eukprot:gene13724-19622_t